MNSRPAGHFLRRNSCILSLTLAALFALPPLASGQAPVATRAAARLQYQPTVLTWEPQLKHSSVTLRVMGPEGYMHEASFGKEKPSFSLGDAPVDGRYSYELVFGRTADARLKAAFENAKIEEDGTIADTKLASELASLHATFSGTFMVSGGKIVDPNAAEPRVVSAFAAPFGGTTASTQPTVGLKDVVTADDAIIQGSLCVGIDCVNNESFGFDTIRLKENNTRIKFQDTSTSAGFTNHSWQLTANDSASGGAEKFSIEDITAATVPFTVTGSAPTNSIFVDSTGRVGFRTSTPVLDLHAATSNTPAIRLEQTNSGGFTAQTWDVAGNEANFFVRDVTGGSKLPFRIRPGAPTSSVDISSSGLVGIGTASPTAKLTVLGAKSGGPGTIASTGIVINDTSTGKNLKLGVDTSVGSNGLGWIQYSNQAVAHADLSLNPAGGNVAVGTTAPTAKFTVQAATAGGPGTIASTGIVINDSASGKNLKFGVDTSIGANGVGWIQYSNQAVAHGDLSLNPAGGNIGVGTTTPAAQLHTTGSVRLAGVANCAAGIMSNANGDLSCVVSSRKFKNVDGELTPTIALANVMALRTYTGSYKATPDEPEHWLIAEEVGAVDPALVGRRDGQPYVVKIQGLVTDLVAVIQQQQRRIEALEKMISTR